MSLQAQGVSFAFKAERLVLRDVSVQLGRGEVVGILGENGAGKSTLLQMLLGWLTPLQGEVTVDGAALHTLSPTQRAQRIAAVMQREKHAFAVDGAALVGLGRLCHGGDEHSDAELVRDALAWADASALANRRVDELSGGEWQRLLLARAKAQASPYWLLDEPTDGLDLAHQLELGWRVRDLARTAHVGVLWVMHDPNWAERVCDRVYCLNRGTVRYAGPMAELDAMQLGELFGVRAEVVQHPAGRRQFWFERRLS